MFGLTPFERNDIWNPFRDFEKDFFKGFGASGHCRTDIKDEGDKYLLECEMPGFDKIGRASCRERVYVLV